MGDLDYEEWVQSILCLKRLQGRGKAVLNSMSIIQDITHSNILCGGPIEVFSSEKKVWVPRDPEEETLRPIDKLYGQYNPRRREVKIFTDQIFEDHKLIGIDFDDFLEIVRLHEYAHSIVHLGISTERSLTELQKRSSASDPAWESFISARSLIFYDISEDAHEFLAQLITYRAIEKHFEGVAAERMLEAFERLEARQSPIYWIPSYLKRSVSQIDLSVLCEAARGDLPAYRRKEFILRDALIALASGPTSLSYCVPFNDQNSLADLKRRLSAKPQLGQDDDLSFQVARLEGLKIEVYAREHAPPHFHIKINGKEAAYTIEDCLRINGNARINEKALREWHANGGKELLIKTWDEMRPPDCPVGPYRTWYR